VNPQNPTVVLVHGAWADGSCWQNVILPLKSLGVDVVCAPLPLTSLTDDIAALARTLERTNGPVVFVGHAYAGAVIAGPTEDRIKALVYIAALAPGEGETVAQVFYREPPHPAIAVKCIQEVAPQPTWKTKQSWYLIAGEDRMIKPTTQRFMAERMGAKIRSHSVDHTPMYSDPSIVVDVISEAVRETLSIEVSARRSAS